MCDSRGKHEVVSVDVHENLLARNDERARHNRAHLREQGVMALNLMGSPGSGKTAVLEATARRLSRRRLGALAADLATDHDARRLRSAGVRSHPITTGTACHLDAALVHDVLHDFSCEELDYLFIENVGNLVCPALYDLGQDANVVALSVTEGEDKPLKYPVMFRTADLVLITKTDLLPHLPEVSPAAIADALARVMPRPLFFPVSARTGEGLELWTSWLEVRRRALLAARTDEPALAPATP
jgi:hydrogenase nickel incorporation protein HypB